MANSAALSRPATRYPELGAELLRLRLLRGLSLRRLARLIGMTAHSGLVDYEHGLRIPPPDLMNALDRALRPPNDRLRALYRDAVGRRVDDRYRALVTSPARTDPSAQAIGTAVNLLETTLIQLREILSTHSSD